MASLAEVGDATMSEAKAEREDQMAMAKTARKARSAKNTAEMGADFRAYHVDWKAIAEEYGRQAEMAMAEYDEKVERAMAKYDEKVEQAMKLAKDMGALKIASNVSGDD
eukprot:GHVS01098129.1.p1 GENE.GHVS01098129.1~~GHVS01098129.1.p1  ORF type:complete len:125 (+),score=22.00 GHVS01098129.1:50-376(+)